ncbi:unnamed protein product [Closterium sp. NIES-54]
MHPVLVSPPVATRLALPFPLPLAPPQPIIPLVALPPAAHSTVPLFLLSHLHHLPLPSCLWPLTRDGHRTPPSTCHLIPSSPSLPLPHHPFPLHPKCSHSCVLSLETSSQTSICMPSPTLICTPPIRASTPASAPTPSSTSSPALPFSLLHPPSLAANLPFFVSAFSFDLSTLTFHQRPSSLARFHEPSSPIPSTRHADSSSPFSSAHGPRSLTLRQLSGLLQSTHAMLFLEHAATSACKLIAGKLSHLSRLFLHDRAHSLLLQSMKQIQQKQQQQQMQQQQDQQETQATGLAPAKNAGAAGKGAAGDTAAGGGDNPAPAAAAGMTLTMEAVDELKNVSTLTFFSLSLRMEIVDSFSQESVLQRTHQHPASIAHTLHPLLLRNAFSAADRSPLEHDGTYQRKGDPLGPLLFAASIQQHLRRTAAEHPEVTILAFADDITMIGPATATLGALKLLTPLLAQDGLTCNLRKSSAWSTTPLEGDELPEGLPLTHEGVRVLGSPVGS